MADQGRWFKLWCSAPADPDLQALSPALRWAWAALGCYVKLHGTRGVLVMNGLNAALAADMGVTPEALTVTIKVLPHVTLEEGKPRHGFHTVTFENWHKYQEDTTMADRARASRSKRRREEKRGDEKRIPPPHTPPPASDGRPVFHVPASVLEALTKSPTLGAVPRLRTPAYWQAEVRANPGVDFAREVLKAEAWMQANPTKAPKRDFPRFLHTWLARADREEESE